MKDCVIGSINEYVAAVTELSKQWDSETRYINSWFRGIGHSHFKLEPRLYRECEGSPSDQERNIRLEFFNRALPYVSTVYDRKHWDWYFLMQHYRVPTRLLDWTESALVALYFALYSRGRDHSTQPAVWMLNPYELNAISIEGRRIVTPSEFDIQTYLPPNCDGPVTGKLPVAICPQRADRRMTAQHSTFTLHGNVSTPLEDMPELQQLLEKNHLVRILIDAADDGSIDRLKRELTILGMRNSTVFPDLEGLAMDICEDYTPT